MEKLRHGTATSEGDSVPLPSFTISVHAWAPVTIGTAAVVVGGMVAAVTGPTGWGHGSWVAAYLVLVVGVGQIGLALGQAAVVPSVSGLERHVELVAFNVGSVVILVGTLAGSPVAVTAGSVVLFVALAAFLRASLGAWARSWISRLYLALLTILTVSIPIGVALSWLRN